MTESEVYELVSEGGATDFSRAIEICREHGAFCLIGGLAVNCYVAPVYTMDADFVMASGKLSGVIAALQAEGFQVREFPHSINAQQPGSQLVLQFSTDRRYEDFLENAQIKNVLGCDVPVAALADAVRGKVWAWSDPDRRFSKRKKDELDLIRLGEMYPEIRDLLPREIATQLEEPR